MGYKTLLSSPEAAVVVMAALANDVDRRTRRMQDDVARRTGASATSASSSPPAYPRKFLFFYLAEMTPGSPTGSERPFQSFVVPNTGTTFSIPFALDIDSPKDCPSELELRISSYDTDQPTFRFGGDYHLSGRKTIRLDEFESIPVWGPYF